MAIVIETATAPSAWASYFINGDDSGLDAQDIAQADKWAATLPGPIVSCEDAGHLAWHDARQFCPLAADCQVYTIHRDGPQEEAEAQREAARLAQAIEEAQAAQDKAQDAREALEEAEAHLSALESARRVDGPESIPGRDLEAAQDALRLARESLEAAAMAEREAEAEESRARKVERQAARTWAEVETLREIAPSLETAPDMAPRDLAEIAPARGWHILAEVAGRRYYLASHVMAEDAETMAEALARRYRAARQDGPGQSRPLSLFVTDGRAMCVNGGPAGFLAALEAEARARVALNSGQVQEDAPAAKWGLVAQLWAGGSPVTVARALVPDLAAPDVTARAWAADVQAWAHIPLARAVLVDLERARVFDILADDSGASYLRPLDDLAPEQKARHLARLEAARENMESALEAMAAQVAEAENLEAEALGKRLAGGAWVDLTMRAADVLERDAGGAWSVTPGRHLARDGLEVARLAMPCPDDRRGPLGPAQVDRLARQIARALNLLEAAQGRAVLEPRQ